MKTFGKGGRVLDRIYTFNFPHAKFTWEEKRALLWLLKTKVFETPEKVYTTQLGSYWGLIRGGLRGVYVINHLNNVEGFERKPTNFEILASSTEAKEYEIKIEGDRA